MYRTSGNFFLAAFLILVLNSCTPLSSPSKTLQHEESSFKLTLLDIYTIPYNYKFKETLVGGLSGIDYDKTSGKYYIISDERSATSPSRFYTANINISNKKITGIEFLSIHNLTNNKGKTFPALKEDPVNAADPESIRYNPVKKNLIWTDEGDKANRNGIFVLRNPSVYEMDLQGNYIDSFSLPENMLMKAGEEGPRTNGVFEGSTFDNDYKHLYVSLEEPLFDDGSRADVDYPNAPIRITKFDVKTLKPVAQYAYLLDAVARLPFPRDAFRVNGVPEILWLDNEKLLVMERSFSSGNLKCAVKIYAADMKNASDVTNVSSLTDTAAFKPMLKKLVLNMDDLNSHIDNVEGMTFGPLLPKGNRTLICIADNNFQMLQKQQVFLFEISP